MRLSKKIAAVALAAVMSVSLLTACGGTDAPSSSNPGSSSSSTSDSSSSSSNSSSSSSSSGSASDSGSSSSSSGSSSNSSTEDKEENVDYKNSRTGRFYQKLGTSYTLGMKMDITTNEESGTADMLIVTNGSRTYQQATVQRKDGTESQTVLTDMTKQKAWALIPDEDLKEQGKLGYCYSAPISGTSTDGSIPGDVMPVEGLKFKQETKGNYYIESQSFAILTDEGLAEYAIAYYFEGNDSAPKYVDVKESLGNKETITIHMTFTRIESKADAKYLDFETILKQYIDVTNKIPSTVQAHEPSIAGLTIG